MLLPAFTWVKSKSLYLPIRAAEAAGHHCSTTGAEKESLAMSYFFFYVLYVLQKALGKAWFDAL